MEKILYLPIETIARELDARLLLAHQALSRDYSVIIGEKSNVFKAAKILKYGIYFYKSHGASNFPADKTGFKYIALDEEGLLFVDDEHYLRNSKPNELEHLDIVFTWGPYQKDLLLKENPDLAGKIIPVGNPRFDLLREEFRSLYSAASGRICKRWGKYVLINTRFVPGNFSRLYGCSYIDARLHQYATIIGREATNEEKNFLIEEEKHYIDMFKRYAKMLSAVSLKFPDTNFILRPHPSEDILNWKEALIGLQNVHVIFEGTAVDWITGSLAVIHTGCTTGIEAWALNVPVIAYNPGNKKGVEPALPNEFGAKIYNIEDLCSILDEVISERFENKISDEELKTARMFIESIDGDYSTTRFLNALEKLPDNENLELRSDKEGKSIYPKLRGMESVKTSVKFRILKFLSKYQPAIRKLTGEKTTDLIFRRFKKYPGLFAQFKKFPGLRSKEIKERFTVYDTIFENKTSDRYLIRKIATDTYLISKKSF